MRLVAFLFIALFSAKCLSAETAIASWYGEEYRGKKTASGIRFNPDLITVAHRSLPFGTVLRIEYNGRVIYALVIDRGPYIDGRELDLSKAAFQKLAPLSVGLIRVKYSIH